MMSEFLKRNNSVSDRDDSALICPWRIYNSILRNTGNYMNNATHVAAVFSMQYILMKSKYLKMLLI